MEQTYSVRCPNCGNLATRTNFKSQETQYSRCSENQVLHTECCHCDYLMVMCSLNGNVIEAHSSSTSLKTQKSKDNDFKQAISPDNPRIVPFLRQLSA